MDCITCHHELTDNPAGPEKPFDVYYTSIGEGPFCEVDYEYWQSKLDRIKAESEEDETA